MKQSSWLLVGWFILLNLPALTWAQKTDSPAGLDPFHLYELRIQFEDKHWENRLKSYKSNDRKDKIPATIYFDDIRMDSVGVRFKGNSSFNSVKKGGDRKLPFSLDAGEFIDGAVFPIGYDQVKLSNGFRDPSYLRDVLSYYIARTYMPAPECAMARVYVNNEYFGVYTLTQDVDKKFLKTWFEEKDGAFFKCDPDWDQTIDKPGCNPGDKCSLEFLGPDLACYDGRYELKSKREDWDALINLTRELKDPDTDLSSILDVDLTLWLHAFNNVIVNLDSYTGLLCHNFYLYQRDDGQFVPLIWDLNLSFGGFRQISGASLDDDQLVRLDPLLQSDNPKRPLISRLLDDPHYERIYLAHMQTILDDFFLNGEYLALMDKWHALIRSSVKAEQIPLYSFDLFEQNRIKNVEIGKQAIIGIQTLMEPRTDYLKHHSVFSTGVPDLGETHVKWIGTDTLQWTCETETTLFLTLYWRPCGEQRYTRTPFLPDQPEASLQKRTFSLELPGVTHPVEYYIVAENEERATVWPASGSRHPLRVDE